MDFNQFLSKLNLTEIKQTNSFFNKDEVQELMTSFSVGCEFEMFIKDIETNLKPYIQDPKVFKWCLGKSQIDFLKPNPNVKAIFSAIGQLLNDSIDAGNMVLYTPQYVPYNERDLASLYHITTNKRVSDSNFKSWQITADYSVKSKALLNKFPIELKTPIFNLEQFFGEPNTQSNGVFGVFLNKFFYRFGESDSSTGLHVNISSSAVDLNYDEIHWPLVVKMMSYLNKPTANNISSDFENRGERKGKLGSTGFSVNNLKQDGFREFMLRYLKKPTELRIETINEIIKSQDEKYSMINFMKLKNNVIELRVMGGDKYEHKAALIKEYVFKLVQSIILCSEKAMTDIWGIDAEFKIAKLKNSSLKSLHKQFNSSSDIKESILEHNVSEAVKLLARWPLAQLPSLFFDARYKNVEQRLSKIFNKNPEEPELRKAKLSDETKRMFFRWLKTNYVVNLAGVTSAELSQTPLQKALDSFPSTRFEPGAIDTFMVFLQNLKRLAANK